MRCAKFGAIIDPAAELLQAALQLVQQQQSPHAHAPTQLQTPRPTQYRSGYGDLIVTTMRAVDEALHAAVPLLLVNAYSTGHNEEDGDTGIAVLKRTPHPKQDRPDNAIADTLVDAFQEVFSAALAPVELDAREDGDGGKRSSICIAKDHSSILSKAPPRLLEAEQLTFDQINIRRVFITPTRVVCLPAELEAANRAFRIFLSASGLSRRSDAESHFLRVTFTDETSPRPFIGGGQVKEIVLRAFTCV